MDIKDIKDKRQEVACKLRKLAKQEWMSIVYCLLTSTF